MQDYVNSQYTRSDSRIVSSSCSHTYARYFSFAFGRNAREKMERSTMKKRTATGEERKISAALCTIAVPPNNKNEISRIRIRIWSNLASVSCLWARNKNYKNPREGSQCTEKVAILIRAKHLRTSQRWNWWLIICINSLTIIIIIVTEGDKKKNARNSSHDPTVIQENEIIIRLIHRTIYIYTIYVLRRKSQMNS